LLSEAVQVKKAIALAQITRNGMRVDREWVSKVEGDLRRRLDQAVVNVRAICPELYKTDAAGHLVCNGKAGAPSKNAKSLAAQLECIAEEIKGAAGVGPSIPLTNKTRRLSTSRQHWEEYADHHPFLRHWMEAEELAKLLQFFTRLRDNQVHPSYTTIVRTGRTSCADPNVQQIPRDGDFRRAFVASPGHLLLAVDYSAIEMRTLAAICWQRYGGSVLADVIKQGRDPHEHTAAMMLSVPVDEFRLWKKNEAMRDQYTAARQAAKAVNFGVPGGLGAQRLMEYAKRTYRVDMTLEEAKQRRAMLTTVYKELDGYLAEDTVAIVARNLQAQIDEVRNELGDLHLTCVRKIAEGNPKKRDGTPYQQSFVVRVWESLARINRNPELKEALERRQPGEALAKKLCQGGVATLTGRIRGRVKYSQARNTPFQGLASDGAALALFKLVREGFHVVGFIHDEILIELPDEGGYVSEEKVQCVVDIMNRQMERVLVGGIPSDCEAALSKRWDKKAKLIVRDGIVYPWDCEPKGDAVERFKPATVVAHPVIAASPEGDPKPMPMVTERSEAVPQSSEAGGVKATCACGGSAGLDRNPAAQSNPLKWHGGKHYLARRIIDLMPPHLHYVEPFFGGGAVLIARDPDDPRFFLGSNSSQRGVSELVNDINGRLMNFWQVVRDEERFQKFRRIVETIPLSRCEWEHAHVHQYGQDPVADAVAFFVNCRQSLAGRQDCFTPITRTRTRRQMNGNVSEWLSAVDGLPAVHARLRRVLIENRPALEIIKREDGPGTLHYIDPPYLPETNQ
jgi:DNA adenine methylase